MTQWICLGNPPHTPPCPATGDTDNGAKRHTERDGHATMTRPSGEGEQ